MLRFSDKINELAAALAAAQAEITGAKKSSVNPHFKSKYADLEDAWDAIREVLPKNGLSVFQGGCTLADGKPGFATLLMHTSGQWSEGVLPLACKDPSDPQKIGSAVTYMRRYGLKAAVGLTDTDDDCNDASRPGRPPVSQQGEPEPKLSADKVGEYMTQIAQCDDLNELRKLTSSGVNEAKAAGDREAQARLLEAGKQRAAMIKEATETVTEDGEVVG